MTDQVNNHNSEGSRAERYASQETVPAEVDTRIEFLTQRFFFHEMIKDGEFARHYIVEDIEVDPATLNDPEAPLFYYLKQLKFKDKAEFLFAKKFYMKIYNYCKMPFAKNDIVNLNYLFDFDNEIDRYYELILVYDYGESDRIDVENISTAHINKFLKNVCLLLNDLKKFDGIYHGNIFLKNIILVNNELKLSGFKSRHLADAGIKSWKNELAKQYGVHRLDLYLIGLLWMVFLNVQVDDSLAKELTLEEVRANVRRLISDLPENKRMDIVMKLLNLDHQPNLTLDDIILDFDEYYILENIKIEDDSRNRHTLDNGMDGENNLYNYDSQDNESYEGYTGGMRKSPSKDTNPFMRPYRESERDINRKQDEEHTAQLYDSREPGNIIKIDGVDFTLRDENSINFYRHPGDEIITIRDVNRSLPHDEDMNDHSNDPENRKTTDPSYNRTDRLLNTHNRHNSEKQLVRNSDEPSDAKKPSMRKLKSNAVLGFVDKGDGEIRNSNANNLKLSNIKQETEEGSEDEKIDQVYSYRNIIDSKANSHVNNKDSLNQKYSGIVENRYNTEDASENEDQYNSFDAEEKQQDLAESIKQYERAGLKGEPLNKSHGANNNGRNSTQDAPNSRKVSNLDPKDNKSKNSASESMKKGSVPKKSSFSNDDGLFKDQDDDAHLSDEEGNETQRDIPLKHKYDVDSDGDKEVIPNRASKESLSKSKSRNPSDAKQKPFGGDDNDYDDEPRISNKYSKSPNRKVHSNLVDEDAPRPAYLQSKPSPLDNIEPKMNTVDLRLSYDDIAEHKMSRKRLNQDRDSKTNEKSKKRNQGEDSDDEMQNSKKLNNVKHSQKSQDTLRQNKSANKSFEKLKGQRGNEDKPKSEWDLEVEREEEAKRRTKDIEEAVKRETERRRQEDEEKRRKEREVLLIKETERLKKEQELKSKIEKKLKSKLEEKEKQRKQESRRVKEERKGDDSTAQREAEEMERSVKREFEREKSTERFVAASKKNHSPELTRQPVSFKKLANSKDKKDDRPSLEQLNKKMMKQVQLSSVVDRKNLFLYNDDLSSKNVSFKKVLTNPKEYEKMAQPKALREERSNEKMQITEIVDTDSAYENLPGFNTFQKNIQEQSVVMETSAQKLADSKMNLSVKTDFRDKMEQSKNDKRVDILIDNIHNKNINKYVKSNMELSKISPEKKKADKVDKLLDNNELNKVEEIKNIKAKKVLDRSYVDIAFEKSLGTDYNYYNSDKQSISQNVRKSDINKKLKPSVISNTEVAISIEEARKDEVDSDVDDDEFEVKIEEIQRLIEQTKYDDSLHLLTELLGKVGGLKKVDVYKMIAMVYFKLKDYKQSINNLKRCIKFIDENPDLPDREDIKRSVTISLVVSLLEMKRYQDAIECLESALFLNKSNTPFSYFTLLGDAYRELGLYEDAYRSYDEQLKRFMTKELDTKAIKSLFLLVNKLILTLNSIGDEVRLVKFYRQVLSYADSLVKVDSTFRNASQEYTIIKEHLLLAILNMLLLKENYNLTNYILNDVIRDKLIDYGKLDDEDKLRFCDTYLNFAMHLKNMPNYGGQKDCYVKYLRQALGIVKTCELTEENVKKELVITFNEGLYYLNQKEYPKAKDSFEESLRLYNSKYLEPDSELFTILYNIGLSLYSMNKFDDCVFFFEKIIKLNCPDDYIKSKTTKMLSKIYYRLGEYQKCHDLLSRWISNNLDSSEKEASNFYIYLAIYYISCARVRSNNFEVVLQRIKKNLERQPEAENIHYFNIFFNLANLSFRNKNYKQNEETVEKINELITQKNKRVFGQEYISLMSRLYAKYILNKNDNLVNEEEFLLTLCAPDMAIEDNSNRIVVFLLNFMFVILNKLPTDPHKEPNHAFRNDLMENMRQLKQSSILYDQISENLTSIVEKAKANSIKEVEKPKLEVKDQKPDTFVLQEAEKNIDFAPKSKTPVKANATPNFKSDSKIKFNKSAKVDIRKEQKELYDEIMQKEVKEEVVQEQAPKPSISMKKLKRANSEDFSEKCNLKKRTKCMCFEPNRKKADITTIIEEFLRQIKNMLFLNITEKIPEYYTKFEEIIKEKRLNWEKYIYIKKLFSFYLKNRASTLDSKKFSILLESLISEQPLCVHDFKMMLVFLESFKNAFYIEAFVVHMDKYHPHMSAVIFRQLFLENFENKYLKIKTDLFDKIHSGKFNIIENYPFIHYLNENNNLIIEKEFTFKVHQRLRYTVLDNKAFFPLFNKYIDMKTLSSYYLRYNVYSALVESIRKDNDGYKVIATYQSLLVELLKPKEVHIEECDFFMYDNLLLMTLLRFNRPNNRDIGDKVLDVLASIEQKIGEAEMYHFSLVSSLIGNILFKHKLYEHSIRAKSMAFDAMRKIKGNEVIFPSFYKEVDPKSLVFNILSYMLMNNLVLSRKEAVDQFYKKIASFETNNKKDKTEQACFGVLYAIYQKDFASAKEKLIQLQNLLIESKLASMHNDMFVATCDRLALDIYISTGKPDDIQRQRERSRGSINKLYNNLVA